MQTENEIVDIENEVVDADTLYTWHPYTQHQTRAVPIEVNRAAGAYLFTVDGRGIFDAISSWWVTTHGHAQPEVADAISHQARTLDHAIFTHFTHEPAALLAKELVEVLPEGLNKVFYSDDGSTAVEAAIKMALQYYVNRDEPRSYIVAFSEAYHGDTFGAMSVSERGLFTKPFAEHLFDVKRIPNPSEGNTVQAFRELVAECGDKIAAIIVEPLLMGTAGMVMYSEEILRDIRNIARENDILFIADEVLTGFGRTGPMFACERAEISPDIICLSKGITGGFLPLGVTVATDEIFNRFLSDDRKRTLFHGHSYTANPISCAAARASLALMNEESEENRIAIYQTHIENLNRLKSNSRINKRIDNARVLGTVAAFNLLTPSSDAQQADSGYLSTIGPRLAAYALERDILLRPLGDVVYILPPYCSTAQDLTQVYSVIEQFLESLE